MARRAVSTLKCPRTSTNQICRDLNYFMGLGSGYWNVNNSCFSNLTAGVTKISIGTVQQLYNITITRAQYPMNQLIVFQLTSSSYALTQPLYWGTNMSCTYVRGNGMTTTSLIQSYPANTNMSTVGPVLNVATNITDLMLLDMTIDRNASSYTTPALNCQAARYFNSSAANASSNQCQAFFWQISQASMSFGAAISLNNPVRTHLSRIKTTSGMYTLEGTNHTISSCVLSSPNSALYVRSWRGHFNLWSTSRNIIVFNNTATSSYGSCIILGPVGTWAHHNYAYNCGWSPFQLDWTANILVENNVGVNYTLAPGAGGGSAGVYAYGGWGVWNNTIRNNWFYGPSMKCLYFDGITSNILWENNVCVVSSNEINGGRYHILRNNLYIALGQSSHLGDLNCPLLDDNNLRPYNWPDCPNVIRGNCTSGYVRGMPWGNLAPNGTVLSNTTTYQSTYIAQVPQLNYDTWCAPKTAGPNNITCATPDTTYTSNGTQYPMNCELFPTNNHLGFVVVYVNKATGNWTPGFGCGPCNPPLNKTFGCPLIDTSSGWSPFIYNATGVVMAGNWYNSTFYNWAAYNGTNSTALFGAYLPLKNSSFVLTPSNIVLSPNSTLMIENPGLKGINFTNMGLLP